MLWLINFLIIFIVLHTLSSIPKGPLSGTRCDLEAIRAANTYHLNSILSELSKSTFFRLARISLSPKNDPFCKKFETHLHCQDDEKNTNFFANEFSQSSNAKVKSECTLEPDNESEISPEEIELAITKEEKVTQTNFENGCNNDLIPKNFWHDLCEAESNAQLVNLLINPERNTGYNGSTIWNAIYAQNCNSTIYTDKNNYDSANKVNNTKLYEFEEKILCRLISAWHASTSAHIAKEFSFKSGQWQPNYQKFMSNIGNFPERQENLHFGFVVLLRALFKAKDSLYNWTFNTKFNKEVDENTKQLIKHLIDSSVMSLCSPVFYAFNETLMQVELDTLPVAIQFKKLFKKITKITDCVTCQKCRLHAKITIQGIGAALKILLTHTDNYNWLERDDIVSLINTLYKFSEALEITQNFFSKSSINILFKDTVNDVSKPSDSSVNIDDALKVISEYSESIKKLSNENERSIKLGIVDLVLDEILNKNDKIIKLAKYFKGEEFIHHASRNIDSKKLELLQAKNKDTKKVYDVIVVGGGLAGTVAAISAAQRNATVLLIDKMPRIGGNSAKASSGINYAKPGDEESFLYDTLKSSEDAGSKIHSEILVKKSLETINWLSEITKMKWNKNSALLGGHSKPRTVRPEKGLIGSELIAAVSGVLKGMKNVEIITGIKVTNLMIEKKNSNDNNQDKNNNTTKIIGVITDKSQNNEIYSNSVILATGGFGFPTKENNLLNKYREDLLSYPTTLGPQTTGDGINMAIEIGASLIDMEYVQLHPTGFIDPKDRNSKTKVLCGEILRGAGGLLFNKHGNRFCNELGTRKDVVDAMLKNYSSDNTEKETFWLLLTKQMAEQATSHSRMYLSMGLLRNATLSQISNITGMNETNLISELEKYNREDSNDFNKNTKPGIPFSLTNDSEWIVGEVVPVIHYTMGGLKIDEFARVIDINNNVIKGLYAVGEVSGGAHGKNRLGGNSLLECAVFGRIAGSHIEIKTTSTIQFDYNAITNSSVKPKTLKINKDEVSKHNTENDCWAILYNSVYDFSGYASDHPGGSFPILSICGTDGTNKFSEVHSFNLLENSGFEKIGELDTIN